MQVSLRWLEDYVDIEMEPEALAERLTMAGLEVEAVERRSPSFSRVVVAKILALRPHPQADRLSLCDVTDGTEVYPLVCGAPNIRVGDWVPLAKTGAILPGGHTIQETRIRGELSTGMLCSEAELGIGSDASGVMIIFRPAAGDEQRTDPKFPLSEVCEKTLTLGEELGEALALTEVIYTISVTPNRADCLSVLGLAWEIAALTGKKIKPPALDLWESAEAVESVASVTIQDPDLCPHYTARIIKDLEIKSSPLWVRLRLEGAGLRAINNVVDATNFVMLEMGQPLHAFDYRYLAEGRIVVRRSREGEIFTTLDGKERVLKSDTLLICDGAKPVAIGGIMGGVNSEVKEDTETVLLESAYFNPLSIRISAKSLGMSTDASFRFERGVDPEGVIRAQNRAALLMAKLAGGVSCRGIIDQHPLQVERVKNIPLRVKRVGAMVGADMEVGEIVPILKSLGMEVQCEERGDCLVTPPTFRLDIAREIDLIEEIVRIRGYDSIPATIPVTVLKPALGERRKNLEERVRGILTGNGYSEIITFSFVTPQWVDRLGFPEGDERRKAVRIKNPLTEDQAVMRTTLLCGLLETMKRNAYTGSLDLKIFEVGKVFSSLREAALPRERNHLGCLLTGMQDDEQWHSQRPADFYDLKGCAESIFTDLKIGEVAFRPDRQEPFLHPGKSSSIIIGGQYAGFIGEVHRDVMEVMDVKATVFVMEIDIDVLSEAFSRRVSYREISRYPSITRDVAFLVSKELDADKMLNFVHENGEELLEKVCIFDVYEGKGIPEGLRSLGLRFNYRSASKTLTDEEITKVHSGIVERIVHLTGARIRG